jgi:quercetin dioxygenase-like cupin family protein
MESLPVTSGTEREVVDGVHLTRLVSGNDMSVLHYQIEPGEKVPEHSHHHEQAGYVLEGEVTFVLADETVTLQPGDSYVLASNEVHAAENRGDEMVVGLDIFSPPRTNPPYDD